MNLYFSKDYCERNAHEKIKTLTEIRKDIMSLTLLYTKLIQLRDLDRSTHITLIIDLFNKVIPKYKAGLFEKYETDSLKPTICYIFLKEDENVLEAIKPLIMRK